MLVISCRPFINAGEAFVSIHAAIDANMSVVVKARNFAQTHDTK